MTFPFALPLPSHPDPRDAPVLRWGVIGPGVIAIDFVAALLKHSNQQVVAVGSRSADRARAFAERFGIARAYGSYDELVADAEVDAIYVATPMSEHHANALLAIGAGKPVLIEKSFTRTAAEARDIRDHARAAGVLVMEAMKTRYQLQRQVIDRLLEDGVLGELDSVVAQFSAPIPYAADSRLFDPALGGGVLLDIGVYPLSFAASLLGEFSDVQATGTLAASGVDDSFAAVLTTPSGSRAMVSASWRGTGPVRAEINGRQARIELGEPFQNPTPLRLISAHGERRLEWDDRRYAGREGMVFQAAAFARYLHDELTDSPLLGLDESVRVMELLDELRHRIGARFADER
ncbi:Gfo/Idh/MocA family oxidoreductase [Diaminobutyricimonas sp. TR449]|uniref:Gfo/Idh/MocA family protein n=1 Tax=Diaminobutyricimonas sp. TR449 TaxID=2708076 RepID=UPI001422D4CD|nr:Gfo/Idh/MocA family oxidoreductase [Diaminobutyricimonas sp. TR449]